MRFLFSFGDTSSVIVAEVFLLGVHDSVLEPAPMASETDLSQNCAIWNADLLIYGRAGARENAGTRNGVYYSRHLDLVTPFHQYFGDIW